MTRILIVDDKEENLYYLEALLTGEGYLVETAQHGAEALVRARQTPPDLVVSDLLMPVMDGYRLLRHWRGDARLKDVPFIVYTATYTEPEDERLALSLGAAAFIFKPAEPDAFLARLREVQAAGPATSPALPPEVVSEEAAMLQVYSEALIRKLEQKTLQLQEVNRALQEDIAARERTEAALRASEAQFASAFVHAAIGMALVAPDGRYLKVNCALCEMLGYSETELLTLTYRDVTHPEDHDDNGAVSRLLAGEVDSIMMEKRYLHRRGLVVWGCLSVSLLRDEAGAPVHLVAQIQDITERKQSEEATRSALHRLEDAQRIGQIGDWGWDIATEAITWSAQVFKILGRDPLLGPPRSYEENAAVFDKPSQALMKEKVTLAVESGETQEYELVARRPDGERLIVLGRAVARKDESGKVLGLYGTIQDITERKRSEAALKKSEQRYRELFQHMLEGYACCRTTFEGNRLIDFIFEEVNGAFETLTGLKDVVGKKISDVIPGGRDVCSPFFNLCERAVLSREIQRGELYLDPLGIWLSLTAYSSEREYFLVIFDNITERKRTEDALRRSEALFRTLVQTSWDAFHLIDPTGEILYESPAVTRVLGYTPEEMIGRNVLDFIHPQEVAGDLAGGAEIAQAPGELRHLTQRVRHKDGSWRWIESHDVNLIEHPNVGGIAVNYRDITDRVEAESSVRQLAAIVESSAVAIIGRDTNGIVTSWNDAAEKIFGYTAGEMVGTRVARLIPADRQGDEHLITSTILRGESVEHFETQRLTRDRRLIEVSIIASPIRDSDGGVSGVSVVARDITARKAAEAAAANLLTVLEASLNEIFIFDAESKLFEYVNETALRNLGYSMEEVRRLTPIDLTPSFESEAFGEMTEPLRSHLKPKIVFESEHRRADGTLYPIEAHMQFVERGDRDVFLVVGNDISERKRAEAALQEREAEFRGLAEAMPQMVWITDGDGLSLYHNQQWMDYTGHTFEEGLGRGWDLALHPDDRDRVCRAWDEAIAKCGLYSVEYRIRRADGVYRWWLVRGVPQRDTAGKIVKWFGTCTDIHDLKQADLEIQTLNTELEQRVALRTAELYAVTQEAEEASHAKSEFLSRTSHELRTPLNAILGFGQLLEVEGRDPEEADSVEQILRAGRHLLDLINEMLDISRIEAGQLELSLQSVSLEETVGETLSLVRRMATDRGVTLEPFGSSAHIVADRQRFKQVVLNLLSNAVKYNRPGGRVTCSVAASSTSKLRFSVTDTGIGIAEADAGKVFGAFERFGASATQVEGIGLGLAITRQLTEQMSGSIGFDSVLGEGSTFWLEFPAAERATASADACAPTTAPRMAGAGATSRKLLYIEDNVSNVRLVTRIVARRTEVEFLSAATGTLGLEMARSQRPDMILLDLHLPDIDGGEVLRRLQADRSTAGIPVVMLSADALPAKRKQMLAAGARAFLTKPLEVRGLLAVVDEYLD